MGSLVARILWPAFTVLCTLSLYRSWSRRRRGVEVISEALGVVGGLCQSVLALYAPSLAVAIVGNLALLAFGVLSLVLCWDPRRHPRS